MVRTYLKTLQTRNSIDRINTIYTIKNDLVPDVLILLIV